MRSVATVSGLVYLETGQLLITSPYGLNLSPDLSPIFKKHFFQGEVLIKIDKNDKTS